MSQLESRSAAPVCWALASWTGALSAAERDRVSAGEDVADQRAPAKPTVLVVDDDEALARLCGRMLVRLGWEARLVTSGREAWSLFESDPTAFDLILTDHSMPDLTGEELATRVHDASPGLPVILMSGYGSEMAGRLATRGLPMRVLPKPFTLSELASSVQDLLPGSRDGRAR